MKNKVEDLRNHLFEVIEKLKDDDIDVARAKVIAETAQVIVNSAKVECEHMRLTGSAGSGFIPVDKPTVGADTNVRRMKAS